MRIREVKIQNYRSLRDVKLENLGDLVILVGKNSSGKTNLLEALWLFFKDFALIPETVTINAPLEANAFMWFEGIYETPIYFAITFELTEKESKEVFPTDFLEAFSKNGKSLIVVKRKIIATPPNMSWNTINLICNGVFFIKNGKVIAPELVGAKPSKQNPPEPNAKSSDPPLVEAEWDETSRNEKLKKGDILRNLKPRNVQDIATKITNVVRDKIKYIQASRGKMATPSNYGIRTSTIEDGVISNLIKIGTNLAPAIRRRWRHFQEDFEKFSPYKQRLSIVQQQPIVDESDLSIPIYLEGGGTQEIVTLLNHIKENEKAILMIEEPENHLHPELAKKLFRFLKQLSRHKQIWISTQSPFFLDKKEINNVWTVSREDNETKIMRLMDKEELKKTIEVIGVKPSDLLFADAILLVEGYTEEDVIPIWAKTLGVDLNELGVCVFPIRGGNKGKYNLKMWKEITRNAQIPLFLILDAHAKKEAEEIISGKLIDRDSCVVSKFDSIEEHYPKKYVLKAIKNEFGIDVKPEELENTKAETIEKILKEKGMELDGWWKPIIGRSVASMMKAEEIPEKIRRLIERIKLTLT